MRAANGRIKARRGAASENISFRRLLEQGSRGEAPCGSDKRGRYVAEELMEDAIHSMQRHPLQAAATSFELGLGIGICLGWISRDKRWS